MSKRSLDLVKPTPAMPLPTGRLMYVDDIVTEIFRDRKSAWWVRHNVAPTRKIKVGRDCAWYEADVYAWLESQRVAG